MKFTCFITSVLTLAAGIINAATVPIRTRNRVVLDSSDPEHDADMKNEALWGQYHNNMRSILMSRKSGCTLDTVQRRVNWNSMEDEEKKLYLQAVTCLHNISSVTDPKVMPGARSRYDDFTATHFLQAGYVHFSGLFLSWHRMYLHLFMTAMRDECNYYGPVPYWDWSKTYKNPLQAPILDGSELSFGGDGEYVPNRPPTEVRFPFGATVTVQPGTGGGCLKNGPFVDFKMHLGPGIGPDQGPDGGRGYNPRCIVRDISLSSAANTRPSNVTKVLEAKDLGEFNLVLDEPVTGTHVHGHFHLGGMQLDPFVSPSDPIFWPHHGMIDYLWSVWQGLDWDNRRDQVWGTSTIGNGNDDVTLDYKLNFEVFTEPSAIRNFVSTIDGPFCYIYE
ncbi:hypothetical protein V8F20_005646 [Naviculisporaceae sp. PSN 640]